MFKTLKEKIITTLVMTVPNLNKPFEIMCDVADLAIGTILSQRRDKNLKAIYYAIDWHENHTQ